MTLSSARLLRLEAFVWARAHKATSDKARSFWFHCFDVANGLRLAL